MGASLGPPATSRASQLAPAGAEVFVARSDLLHDQVLGPIGVRGPVVTTRLSNAKTNSLMASPLPGGGVPHFVEPCSEALRRFPCDLLIIRADEPSPPTVMAT